MTNRNLLSLLWLLLMICLAGGSGGPVEDDFSLADPAEDEEPAEETVFVNLTCRNSGVETRAWCGQDEACLPAGSEVWCMDEFVAFYPTEEKSVNNWNRDGHWEEREGKTSVFSLFVSSTRERQVNPIYLGRPETDEDEVVLETIDVAMAFNRSAIILFGDVDGLTSRSGTTHGIGVFRGYRQNMLQDDMYIEVMSWLSDEEYAAYQTQEELQDLLKKHSWGQLENTRLYGESEEELWDRVERMAIAQGEPTVRTLLRLKNQSYDAIREAGEAARTVREEAARPELEENAYARLRELTFEMQDSESESSQLMDDGNWSIPTRSDCGTAAPGDSEEEIEENEANRTHYQEQITNRYLLIDLDVDDPGEYDSASKGFPVTFGSSGYSNNFVISGKTEVILKHYNMLKCCDMAGNCSFRLSCRTGERRRNFTSSDYEFDEDVEQRTITIVDESEYPNKPLGLTGEAIVRIQNVVRICPTSIDTSRYTGEVAAIRLMDGDEIVFEEMNVDISVEDALKGRDRFLDERINNPQ